MLNVRYHVVQVAGRLHVEVIRVAGGFQDSVGGGEEGDSSPDMDNQDRKLVCMVSILSSPLALTLTLNTQGHLWCVLKTITAIRLWSLAGLSLFDL